MNEKKMFLVTPIIDVKAYNELKQHDRELYKCLYKRVAGMDIEGPIMADTMQLKKNFFSKIHTLPLLKYVKIESVRNESHSVNLG